MKTCKIESSSDWRNNFDFEEAKRKELKIIGEIKRKANDLLRIVVIDDETKEEIVNINDYVLANISFENEEETMIFKLVGTFSPDDELKIPEIGINTPLGKAVYKKQISTETSYEVNGNITHITIVDKAKNLDDLIKTSENKNNLERKKLQ